MEQDVRDEPRAENDSRKRRSVEPRKAATVESKPSLGQRWRDYQPTKTILFWACLASIVLSIFVGFTWGGWVTAGTAQKAADALARDAVIQRLVPICVDQFNQDPDRILKLDELSGLTSYKQTQYVQEQGWATITGMEKPDRKVASLCTKLLMEMSQ
jgi:hypothetical protein